MARPFQLIDVFGVEGFSGNPLAVVAAAEDLDADAMLTITRWLNFSETTFLLPPTDPAADYRVRIFCPPRELPFAGHPTLGSCHAWLEAGGLPKRGGYVVQECGAGLVTLRRDPDGLAFAAPPLRRSGPIDEAELATIAKLLRIDRAEIVASQWACNGPEWAAVMLKSADAVLALDPVRAWDGPIEVGVVGPHAPGGDAAFEIRALFADQNGALVEDPVTGSLNAAVAQWLLGAGLASAPYVAAQGTRLGRTGRVRIDQDDDGVIWVGGKTETLFSGEALF